MKLLAKVRPKMTSKQVSERMHASRYGKNKPHEAVFDGPTPSELSEAGEAYRKFGSSGSASLAYRYARLLRDAPKIAADVQKGRYIKQQKNGKFKVDLEQAEKDAGLWRPPKKRGSVKRTAAERAIDTLNKTSKDELRELVNRFGPRLKKHLLDLLK